MNLIQIEPQHLKIVQRILSKYDYSFFVFGSRSKGTAKQFSDLDLVIKSKIAKAELANVRQDFEDSNLPYKVDIVVWDEIDTNFKNHIISDLKPLPL